MAGLGLEAAVGLPASQDTISAETRPNSPPKGLPFCRSPSPHDPRSRLYAFDLRRTIETGSPESNGWACGTDDDEDALHDGPVRQGLRPPTRWRRSHPLAPVRKTARRATIRGPSATEDAPAFPIRPPPFTIPSDGSRPRPTNPRRLPTALPCLVRKKGTRTPAGAAACLASFQVGRCRQRPSPVVRSCAVPPI